MHDFFCHNEIPMVAKITKEFSMPTGDQPLKAWTVRGSRPGPAAELMIRRAAQEQEFAPWLLQVATAHASSQGHLAAPATCPRPLATAPVLPPGPAATNGPPDAPLASMQRQAPAPDLTAHG